MIDWNGKGNKVFWYISSDRDGRPGVRFPDGTEKWPSLRDYRLDPDWNLETRNAYIRENMFLEIYDIWDLTAFAASMSHIWKFQSRDERTTYAFASVSHAEDVIYPLLTKEQIEICKDNVRMFYNDPNLQAGWPSMIVLPLSFVVEDDDSLTPIYIGEIGDGESVMFDFERVA